MGKSTGQLELQRWDQVDLSAQGKSPAPWLLLAISIRFFCACVLVSPLTLPTPPLPHGPLQVGVTPALSFECWIELKGVNWWGGFAGFLSPRLASFFSPLISLSHPSESTLLQLHLHLQVSPTRYHTSSSSPCCLVTSATSANVGYQVCTRACTPSSLPQTSSPHWDPGHDISLWVTSCSGQHEILMSIIPCYISKQTPSCLPWSWRAMPYALWHHCLYSPAPSKFSLAFHCPLLSCIQPLSSVLC